MSQPQFTSCPHCGFQNVVGSQFCQSCGKSVGGATGGPRIVEGGGFASTNVGAKLQGDELKKKAKSARTTLLVVAILMFLGLGVLYFVFQNPPRGRIFDPAAVQVALIIQAVVAFVFLGLWFWARKSPLPATIVGLIVYCTLIFINAVADLQR